MKSLIPFRKDVVSIFDSLEREFNNLLIFDEDLFKPILNSKYSYPKVDIVEDNEKYVVEAAIPGLSKEDIKTEVKTFDNQKYLVISGKKEYKEEDKTKNYIRKEIHHSSFNRSFYLNESVVEDKIVASFNDGVLKVILPKKEVKEEKVIDSKSININ